MASVHYLMFCPIHSDNEMDTIKRIERNDSSKKEPLFECEFCKKYYMYDPGEEGRKIGSYGDRDVISTRSKYRLYMPVFGKKAGTGKEKTSTDPTLAVHWDNTVRIRRVKDNDVPRAKNNLVNIRNKFPDITTDKMSLSDFILKVCGRNEDRICEVKNLSQNKDGKLLRRVEFYVKNSKYLEKRLPECVYISFYGRLAQGEFVVEEVRMIENQKNSEEWETHNLKFAYDGPNLSNWLYNFVDARGAIKPKLSGELASWRDYLDWKRQLVELRIKGIKYISFDIDADERKMTFLSVAEGMKQVQDFRSFLNRNEVSIFSNKYSKNRWIFEFDKKYQDNQDSGVDVVFMEYGECYHGEPALRSTSWRNVNSLSKKYGEGGDLSFADVMKGIRSKYKDPVFQEIVFELTERALTLIKIDVRKNGGVTEQTEKTIAEGFYSDGFLATAQIGDFTLLGRFQRAIDDFSSGKCTNQSLEQWLFDINKAEKPQELGKINTWQNTKINERQKTAIEKIVSAPDVCLIQGPPGTGKTTVIAEAIYQFAAQNKRVLITSQANLAVDNALERLISNPKIRAIRLGSAKKIDESVKGITEEFVLETFYKSIVEYIQRNYLNRWEEADLIDVSVQNDYQKFQEKNEQAHEIEGSIEGLRAEEEALKKSTKAPLRLNALLAEKMNIMMILSFCENKSDLSDLELSIKRIVVLWCGIEEKLRELYKKKVVLTKIGLNLKKGVNYIDEPEKTERANRIIKHILLNTKTAIELHEKLTKIAGLGGDSGELENLTLLEIDLREKMVSDPNVVTEWQGVCKRIKELKIGQTGFALNEEESRIFFGIDTVPEKDRQQYLKELLDKTVVDLRSILLLTSKLLMGSLPDLEKEIKENAQKEEELRKQISEIEEKISEQKVKLDDIQSQQTVILNKYNAKLENFDERMNEYKVKKKEEMNTWLKRDEWEDIFLGLKDWVDGIPDYSQEKDLFLREYINGCNVVGVSCTENARTLSENGFDDFDVVIIDEVSKATPPELLIPMLKGKKIVLVGDHRQLPPLFNEQGDSYEELAKQQDNNELDVPLTMDDFNKYKEMVTASLFERYFKSADEMIKETLTYQYRMHGDIMDIVNLFYDGLLRDGNEDDYTEDTKAHYLNIYSTFETEMIVPERHAYWFDSSQLSGVRVFQYQKPGSHSFENVVEAETIIELLRKMENEYANKKIDRPVTVGVISFYFDQVSLLRKMIKQESYNSIDVEVNTVDRFQGKEKEIVFVSMVRNVKRPRHSIDSFFAAFQRINVAFSRAQNLLIILGATDMYLGQPVRITDSRNIEKVEYPYDQIWEMMQSRGTSFTCDEVIPEERVDEILMVLSNQRENQAW